MLDYRPTHKNHQLTKEDIGKTVTLSGWVHRARDHGGLIFVDLRDRFGLTQAVFDPEKNLKLHSRAEKLRSEWVITLQGTVVSRAEGMSNPKLPTGEIEVEVHEMEVLSKSKTPPISISDAKVEAGDEVRLKYRYLDIRRGRIANNLILRHKAQLAARNFLDKQEYLEITTPIMAKSTPETGARDYLVPSRVYPGSFFALPQSPQIYKQLLMLSGMHRYFQIAQCFRDEDLRSDRQPEFTQVDIEMSFATPEELMALTENLVKEIFLTCKGIEIKAPFQRLTYEDCMKRYGTDKPDTRFGMEIAIIDDIASRSTFSVFKEQIESEGTVRGICVKGGADISRKSIDDYTKFVGQLGIRGLAWMKYQEEGLSSSIVKFFSEEQQQQLIDRTGAEKGDLIFMIADEKSNTLQALDHLRRKLARDRDLIPKNVYEPLWVTDFPLFHWNKEEQIIESEHHPFTSPHFEDLSLLDSDPLKVRSLGYDLVLHGHEIGGGSQRIHDNNLQTKIFEILQLTPEEVKRRFGFFLDALSFGTPPHLGIALGLDRLMMILCDTENIRDVIAFPKTQKAADLMSSSPSEVAKSQLDLLKLSIEVPDE